MKTRRIWMWHGTMPNSYMNKLASFCDSSDDDPVIQYVYTGTLDDFEVSWGGKFMVMGDIIAVTHNSNFNPR